LTSPASISAVAETLAGFIGRAPYNVSQQDVGEVVFLLKIYRAIPIVNARALLEILDRQV